MKNITKRLISFLLAFVMVVSMLPAAVFAADVTASEMYEWLEEYYGDAAQAKSAIAKLQKAGFLDRNGNIVPMEICYEGKSVSFAALNRLIEDGKADGEITFNGNVVTPSQVAELKDLYDMLEFALSLGQDVTITDETVANLQSLAEAIAAGELDFTQNTGVKSSAAIRLDGDKNPDWPETQTGSGDLTLKGAAGSRYYEEHYVGKTGAAGGAGYQADHHFVLINQNATKWYSDDLYDGSGIHADSVVSFTISGQVSGKDYFSPNTNVTITAKLNKAQPVPVSFQLRIVEGSLRGAKFSDDNSTQKTVVWDANTNANKTFTVKIPAATDDDKWSGGRVFYLQAQNFKNVGCGSNDVWEQAVKVCPTSPIVLSASGQILETYGPKSYNTEKDYAGQSAAMAADFASFIASHTGDLYSAFPTNLDSTPLYQLSFDPSIYIEAHPKGKDWSARSVDGYDELIIDFSWGTSTTSAATPVADAHTGKLHFYSNQSGVDGNIFYQFGDEPFKATFTGRGDGTQLTGGIQFNDLAASALNGRGLKSTISATFPVVDTEDDDYFVICPFLIFKIPYTISAQIPPVSITSVSIPDGRFYYGQNVPITVFFSNYVTVSDKMTLTVNGSATSPAPEQIGLVGKSCTFLYPVKRLDTGTALPTKLEFAGNNILNKTSEVKGGGGLPVSLTNSDFNGVASADLENTNCKIISDIKLGGLRVSDSNQALNVTYGIDDEPPTLQNLVIQYDIRQDSDDYYKWIGGAESVDISSKPVKLTDKTGALFSASDYLAGAYISCDGGLTRYPLFVQRTTDGYERPLALVANIAPQTNPTADIRKDTYEMFFERDTLVSGGDTYLPAFENAVTDSCGNYYFVCGTRDEEETGKLVFTTDSGLADANAVLDAKYSILVKGGIFLEEDYGDVTIVGNDTWDSIHNACAIETSVPTLKLGYTINDRQPDADPYYTKNMFTFRSSEWFTWESSDETIATIEQDGTINLTGKPGTCHFILHILNGNIEQFMYTLQSEDLTVKEGLNPYLLIPATSACRTTLQNEGTSIYFATNHTARNAAEGQNATDFYINVYKKADTNEYDEPDVDAVPVYTGKVTNTLTASVSRMLIPENVLCDVSPSKTDYSYVAIISTTYYDGTGYSASAHITVKKPPAKVTLSPLDSYYVLSDELPVIGYNVEYFEPDGDVYYTLQKGSGSVQTFSLDEASGVISTSSFTKPTTLKEVYAVTVYAKNPADEVYSVDSMLLTVYNRDLIDLVVADVTRGNIGGTTGGTGDKSGKVVMDNNTYIKNMLTGRNEILLGEGKTITLDELRFDTNLQKAISINYGDAVYGMLSDRIAWASKDSSVASVDYEQGGMYANVEAYDYTSYAPVDDLLIVGHEDGKTTITAEHINTGVSKSVDVTVNTLKDKLYIFQFLPKQTTDVQYYTTVSGKNTLVSVQSNADGELAVYEPNGIQSDVWLKSKSADGVYLGTIYQQDLYTAERDIAARRVYPCNDKALQLATETTLYFRTPDGKPYANKTVTLRAGVYKNDLYCPDATFRTNVDNYSSFWPGRSDFTAKTDSNGAVTLRMDADEFYVKDKTELLLGSDRLDFVFEYRFSDAGYVPGYVITSINGDKSSDNENGFINIAKSTAGVPTVIHQFVQQYYKSGSSFVETDYVIDVAGSRDNVGLSNQFEKVRLENVVSLYGETVSTLENGYASYDNSAKFSAYLLDENGVTPSGQNTSDQAAALVTDLKQLGDEKTAAFVFPFSTVPMLRSVYVMNRTNFGQYGSTKHTADDGSSVYNFSYLGYGETVHDKVIVAKDGVPVSTTQLPFAITNYADKSNPLTDGTTEQVGRSAQASIKDRLDIGSVFDQVDVNDMLKKGFSFFISLGMEQAGLPIDLEIFPTEDPTVFRVLISMGIDGGDEEEEEASDEDSLDLGYNVQVNPKQAMQAIEELASEDEDEEGEDGDASGSFSFNFHGAVEAEVSLGSGNWNVEFIGGSVGAGAKAGFKYSMDFMVGPVPALIRFEANAAADLTVFFAKRDSATDILIKALLEASLEAFAGVGFDAGIAELTLGIFGKIDAGAELLFLRAAYNSMGMHLQIDGEIGLRFTAKVAMISYSNVFASTSFGWQKDYKDYAKIKEYWSQKDIHLTGLTSEGDPVKVTMAPDGSALLAVSQNRLENRDYLTDFSRQWMGGSTISLNGGSVGLDVIQTNSYPYSQPDVTDDGEILLYLSDEDSSDEVKSVLNYAIRQPDGSYDEYGPVDAGLTPRSFADTAAAAAGTNGSYVTAWVGQVEELTKEAGQNATGDDLALMLNASEIFAGIYNPSSESWKVTRLTENSTGDLTPAVAASGSKAITAWRGVDFSTLQADEGQNLLDSFNVTDTINYRYFNGTVWKTEKLAYSGSSGTPDSLSAAMLPDGTALLAYSVSTDNGSEVFYTLINKDGECVNTIRVTNDENNDVRVRVCALDCGGVKQFVLCWYRESVDERITNDAAAEPSVSGELRFTAVNANGSVNTDFIEGLGRQTSSTFCMVGNSLDQLAVLWSEKDGDAYAVRAMKFCDGEDGTTALSAPITVAQTEDYVNIERFDAFADETGTLHAILLCADYQGNVLKSVGAIDVNSLRDENGQKPPIVLSETPLAILEAEPEYKMLCANKALPESDLEASIAKPSLASLVRGLSLPLCISVKNTGVTALENLSVTVGGQTQLFPDTKILPGGSEVLMMSYDVPSTIIDEPFTVTADGGASDGGTLVLNCPDVGIQSVKQIREENGERTIAVALENASDIPLSGSSKKVLLAFYTDSEHTKPIGSEIAVDPSEYENIDLGFCTVQHTLKLSDLLSGQDEIPAAGVKVYVKAWVADTEEPYSLNNTDMITLKSLLTKNNDMTFTMNGEIRANGSGYDILTSIRNNSLQSQQSGKITALILDSKGAVIGQKAVYSSSESFSGEQTKQPSLSVDRSELSGTPASVQLVSVYDAGATVTFDANGGTCSVTEMKVGADGRLSYLPTPTRSGYTFIGWYTDVKNGTAVKKDSVFYSPATVYAHWQTANSGGFSGGGGGESTPKQTNSISYQQARNGTVIFDTQNAKPGDTVMLTVKPDDGYVLEKLVIVDKNGNEVEISSLGDNRFSFIMPDSEVTVKAVFAAAGASDRGFVDFSADDYYYEAVLWAAENQITNGIDAEHFGPDITTTRAQVVTFLWRAAGCPEPGGSASKFTDVESGSYYEKAVAWAVENGITKGTAPNAFSPNQSCTRGQIVTFLARFAGVSDAATESVFTDVHADDFFAAAVKWAKENGVTDGISKNQFGPYLPCTRAQVVTFLYRLMG